MELLQTHDVKKYDEVYKMIVSSGLDPDFYIPPRQRVRFVRKCSCYLSKAIACLPFQRRGFRDSRCRHSRSQPQQHSAWRCPIRVAGKHTKAVSIHEGDCRSE